MNRDLVWFDGVRGEALCAPYNCNEFVMNCMEGRFNFYKFRFNSDKEMLNENYGLSLISVVN